MARFPSLPLFIDAYLADTGHLTDAEHGRYLLLLIQMWRIPGCRLPNDDAWLARHFRRSVEQVQAELRPIISEFMQTDGNWITQKRLVREYRFVTIAHEKRSVAAKSREYNKKTKHNAYAPTPTPTQEKKEERECSNEHSARSKKRKPETEFPAGWILSVEQRQCAIALRWPTQRIDYEFEHFRNYALANDRRYRSWPAAWRNWVNSPYRQNGAATTRPMTLKERKQQEWQDAYDELKRHNRENESSEGGGTVMRLFPAVTRE